MPFIRPRTLAGEALLWLPKLLGGALSPVTGMIGTLAALIGLGRRDWRLAGTGLLSAGLAARLAADLPDVDHEMAGLPGSSGERPVPGTWSDLRTEARSPGPLHFPSTSTRNRGLARSSAVDSLPRIRLARPGAAVRPKTPVSFGLGSPEGVTRRFAFREKSRYN